MKEIEKQARANNLRVEFHSSRAELALERTIGDPPPPWKPGSALKSFYTHPIVQKRIAHSLRKTDFTEMRTLRPLATAAEGLDSTLPPRAFTFREAWPALKKTQDREVSITPAVVTRTDAIQVMTIHAAKGLEFPIVLMMKLGKSFPRRQSEEDARLAYVGATRARDLLILVHAREEFRQTLNAFGRNLVPIRRDRRETASSKIGSPAVVPAPPIIAATHLDLYEQCPLQFAAYHEGRFLPKWTPRQSRGARMHKAVEYYLRAEMPDNNRKIEQCFQNGFDYGDSPLRQLPESTKDEMKRAFRKMVKNISETSQRTLAIEQRFRYLQKDSGQVEGVIDALIERRDSVVVLKEWKTSAEVEPGKKRQYELQARAGALGMIAQNSHPIQLVEIVPILYPENTVSIPCDNSFVDDSKRILEQVFKDLKDRSYEPRRGNHCKWCQLKPQCPAWPKN